MPEKRTIERARQDAREGKAPSTQAGEFVREEMEHIREGKHGARSTKQAIAIGLSKARRAGVKLPTPKRGRRRRRLGPKPRAIMHKVKRRRARSLLSPDHGQSRKHWNEKGRKRRRLLLFRVKRVRALEAAVQRIDAKLRGKRFARRARRV